MFDGFRKNTCPECRSKTTSSTVIRLFVNIVDNPYSENEGGAPDLVNLQNENDNLKYRIIEKDGAIKSKEDALARLQEENKKLSTSQAQSRKVILALEKKFEQSEIIARDYNDQVRNDVERTKHMMIVILTSFSLADKNVAGSFERN